MVFGVDVLASFPNLGVIYQKKKDIIMLYINHSKVYMANILPETEVRGSLQ